MVGSKIHLEVIYEAGMGQGSKRFKADELPQAIEFAQKHGGTLYRVEELWSIWDRKEAAP